MAAYHVFPSYDVLVVQEISLFHKTPSPPNKRAVQLFATHSLALQQILQKMTGEFQGIRMIPHLIQRIHRTLWVSTGCPALVRNTGIIHSSNRWPWKSRSMQAPHLVICSWMHICKHCMHSVLCLQNKPFIKGSYSNSLYLLLGKVGVLSALNRMRTYKRSIYQNIVVSYTIVI